MDIRIVTAAGLGIVAVGVFAAVTLRPNPQESKSKPLVPAQIIQQKPENDVGAAVDDSEFQTMAIESDNPLECSLPKTPNSIGNTALIRNSYGQVMRLIALKKWEVSGSCACFYNQITWDEVIQEAPKFERTDGVALQFDFPTLLKQADELSALRLEACVE